MTPIPAALLPLATLAIALTGNGGLEPVLEQNAAWAAAGEKQVRRDIRSCFKSAEFERASLHPDVTRTDDRRAVELLAKRDQGRDPAYERSVEVCLEKKGYKVTGWEKVL